MDRRRRHSRRAQADLELRSIALKQIVSLLKANDVVELCRVAQRAEQGQSDTDLVSDIVNDACSRGSQHLSGKYHNFSISYSSSAGTERSLNSDEPPSAWDFRIGTVSPRLLSAQENLIIPSRSIPTTPDVVLPSQPFTQPVIQASFPACDTAFFEHLADILTAHQAASHVSPSSIPTLSSMQDIEVIVRATSDLKNLAQRSIAQGSSACCVVGCKNPDLTLLFRERTVMDTGNVWNWAAELAKSYKCLSFSMQLSVLYFAGIQMRVSGSSC